MSHTFRALILVVLLLSFNGFAQEFPQLTEATIKEVIKELSLEEKAALVVGTGLKFGEPYDSDKDFIIPNKPIPGSLAANSKMYTVGAVGRTLEVARLGISTIEMVDGPAGVSFGSRATAFPIANSLASTWDKNLVYEIGACMGKETLEYGLDVLLAPGINIHRNPLTGRNFEYLSEDPLLSGQIGAAIINGIQSQGVGASLKHFAANNQETNRIEVDAVISERALREIYLKGFEIAINESNPLTLMASYNSINGELSTQNYDLLTKISRNDWGYEGIIMSDWEAGLDPVKQMKAGLNLIMPGPYQNTHLVEAVKNGELDESILDQNIELILQGVMRTPKYKKYPYNKKIDFNKHSEIAKLAASEGMVLLKNNKASLPIDASKSTVALFGNASYETIIGGSGSGFVMNSGPVVNLFQGLENHNFRIDTTLKSVYEDYILSNTPSTGRVDLIRGRKNRAKEMEINLDLIESMAEVNDYAILTISRISGETKDRMIQDDFNLTELEVNNMKAITSRFHAHGKKVIVLLNIGGVIETQSWKHIPDAILLTWLPGEVAGDAMAEVINGRVNPSGRLTSTFPCRYEDVPSASNFPGTPKDNPKEVIYQEGIYVGYRYYDTFGVETSYPFGYGLSYSEFSYGDIKLNTSKFKDEIEASITITNTGDFAGKEVVQLYIVAPSNHLNKPDKELKAFAKTKDLKPNESQTIKFKIGASSLSSFDSNQSAWIAEAGMYKIKIGASSTDIKAEKTFTLKKEILARKVGKALVPKIKINELSSKQNRS